MILNHPEIARRSCEECQRYVYDSKGKPVWRKGRRVERTEYGAWCTPDCTACPKCDGAAEKSPQSGRRAELSKKNQRTLQVYYESQACPLPTTDALLRRNLGIIHGMLDAHRRSQSTATLELLSVAAQIMARR